MPDCRLKYQIIVERAERGMGKYVDNQFGHDNKALGREVANKIKNLKWERLSEVNYHKGQYCIFKDGVSIHDVTQGQIGTCYLLSSFSLLDEETIKDKFIILNSVDEWRKCGAFCIKFFDMGKEDIYIIDDFYPMRTTKGYEKFAFASGFDKLEIWIQLLEKAYAKKYGSFSAIEGGCPHMTLAELMNGMSDWD